MYLRVKSFLIIEARFCSRRNILQKFLLTQNNSYTFINSKCNLFLIIIFSATQFSSWYVGYARPDCDISFVQSIV